jgi:hypothetical protein
VGAKVDSGLWRGVERGYDQVAEGGKEGRGEGSREGPMATNGVVGRGVS